MTIGLSPSEELGRQVKTCASEFSPLRMQGAEVFNHFPPLLSLIGAMVRVFQLARVQTELQKSFPHVQVGSEQIQEVTNSVGPRVTST